MLLHIDLGNRQQLVRQIHAQIRAATLDGTLRAGERLPSSRDLARQLAVSRNTVAAAYDWLLADGLIEGRAGAGSFVRDIGVASGVVTKPHATPLVQPFYRDAGAAVGRSESSARYAFRAGVPDGDAFPHVLWRRAMMRQMKRGLRAGPLDNARGDIRLREAIARHVAASRGLRVAARDIVVTNGAQQGFALLADVLVARGACVAVEEPGYRPLRLAFESRGARVVGIPVDAEGIVVAALPREARIICVTPSHQFPLGISMSHGRRGELLAWAERRNAIVVEDDYDSEFRFAGPPIGALHSLDRAAGRVVYVGTFSKTLLPSLRLGFLVAPPTLCTALGRARTVADLQGNEQMQGALADFLDSGALARHVRRMRRLYSARHELILRSLREELAPWLVAGQSAIGLHLTARLRRHSLASEAAIVTEARRRDVEVAALSAYFFGKRRQSGLVLGYGATATADLPEALRRLRVAIEAVV